MSLDHNGHVARLKGAMDAIGLDGSKLDIVLMQLVRLMTALMASGCSWLSRNQTSKSMR